MDKMRIEIWSDIACPYCYIGKRKLEMALDQFENKNKIELVWYSYELDPSLPKKAAGISAYEHLAKSYDMTIEEATKHEQGVADIAKSVGLDYDFDNLIITNTSDALRLVKLAAKSGLATEAEEVLFRAYFIDAQNISDRQTLVSLGEEIGLKADDINKMLDSDEFYDRIQKDKERAETKFKLKYIPFYRLNYNQIIEGSIEVEDYLKAIKAAYADWENGTTSETGTISGQSCSIDGVCS